MEELRRAAQSMRAAAEAIKRKRELSPPIVISDSDDDGPPRLPPPAKRPTAATAAAVVTALPFHPPVASNRSVSLPSARAPVPARVGLNLNQTAGAAPASRDTRAGAQEAAGPSSAPAAANGPPAAAVSLKFKIRVPPSMSVRPVARPLPASPTAQQGQPVSLAQPVQAAQSLAQQGQSASSATILNTLGQPQGSSISGLDLRSPSSQPGGLLSPHQALHARMVQASSDLQTKQQQQRISTAEQQRQMEQLKQAALAAQQSLLQQQQKQREAIQQQRNALVAQQTQLQQQSQLFAAAADAIAKASKNELEMQKKLLADAAEAAARASLMIDPPSSSTDPATTPATTSSAMGTEPPQGVAPSASPKTAADHVPPQALPAPPSAPACAPSLPTATPLTAPLHPVPVSLPHHMNTVAYINGHLLPIQPVSLGAIPSPSQYVVVRPAGVPQVSAVLGQQSVNQTSTIANRLPDRPLEGAPSGGQLNPGPGQTSQPHNPMQAATLARVVALNRSVTASPQQAALSDHVAPQAVQSVGHQGVLRTILTRQQAPRTIPRPEDIIVLSDSD